MRIYVLSRVRTTIRREEFEVINDVEIVGAYSTPEGAKARIFQNPDVTYDYYVRDCDLDDIALLVGVTQ